MAAPGGPFRVTLLATLGGPFMKFLCGNCKAKYQIADEKISGRTLRMKCRRCNHDIIIKGR